MAERIRIVVADVTSGGSDDRATSIARALRDAGTEIVWTGPDQTPEQLVQTAVQEDADALVVVLQDGTNGDVLHRTIGLLVENDAADVDVFGVGIDPAAEVPEVRSTPAVTIFATGASTGEIVRRIHADVGDRSDA